MRNSDHRETGPECTVCIANYNGELMLEDCLTSIFNQVGGHCIEIIVHDDASTDGSLALLRSRYPNVRLLESRTNVGFCESNNRMAKIARGKYLLLLNNDAALYEDAVRTLLQTASESDAAIMTLPQYDWTTGTLVDRGCLLDPFYNPVPNLDAARTEVAMVIGACMFLKRTLWEDLGGFPHWIESIGEDLYLCCVARLRALRVVATVNSGYRHRQGKSFGGNRIANGRLATTYRRRKLSERNKTFAMFISTPLSLLWALLPLHLFLLTVEGITLSVAKRDPAVWRLIYGACLADLYGNLSRLKTARGNVQAYRKASLAFYLSSFTMWPRKLSLFTSYGIPGINKEV